MCVSLSAVAIESIVHFGVLLTKSQVKGRSHASHQVYFGWYLRDVAVLGILCTILRRLIRQVVISSVSHSCILVAVVLGSASREVGALVLDDLLKYIVQDSLWIIWVVDLVGDAEDVATLAHVVVNIFVVALVRELC